MRVTGRFAAAWMRASIQVAVRRSKTPAPLDLRLQVVGPLCRMASSTARRLGDRLRLVQLLQLAAGPHAAAA